MATYAKKGNRQVKVEGEKEITRFKNNGYEIFELTPKKGEKGKFNKKVIHQPENIDSLKKRIKSLETKVVKLEKENEELKAK